MCAKPAALDSALEPFMKAGMRVSVAGTHLLLHDVPVVDEHRTLHLGTLIAVFVCSDSGVSPPATHQVWFDGPYPCFADGRPLDLSRVEVGGGLLAPGVPAKFHFSNKPEGWSSYANHFDQLMHYWRLITDQARVIDSNCTLPVPGSVTLAPSESPFRYPDACSARSNTAMVSAKLAGSRVAIVGLGGTGSYVLDQVAKTPVRAIHLFDGDVFELHNAFRAPGAAQLSQLDGMKVDYFARMYDPMHGGIVPHAAYVTESNVALLGQFDFVFVCVDRGPARKLICGYLLEHGIAFVDCGMDLSVSPDQQIYGTCRATLCTPGMSEHFWSHAPTMEEAGDGLYNQNVQIADANALNALLAVMRWKQHVGFYAMTHAWHQMEFMLQNLAHARSKLPRGSSED